MQLNASMPTSTSKVLPRLPIPDLQGTLNRYLDRVGPLQDERKHQRTRDTVLSNDNLERLTILQERLIDYDRELSVVAPQSSYIEQFWYDSYLQYDESVVLNVNPYFELQDDPTLRHCEGTGPFGEHTRQVQRAGKLVLSILKFVREIRRGTLKEDKIRGNALSMDQYGKLFGSARIPPGPKDQSCHLQTDSTSHHVVVMYKSQFYWFDVLDLNNNPIFSTLEELEWNLYSIVKDGDKTENDHLKRYPWGIFTTENRRVWSNIRDYICKSSDNTNWKNLKIIDSALFIICLDDVSLNDEEVVVKSMLCGTSEVNLDLDYQGASLGLPIGVQRGTCLNRWYDKLQLIVTRNGKAGINFEHTGIDGHTVLRLATDIYTDSMLSFAQGITKSVPRVFHDEVDASSQNPVARANLITIPRKLEWQVDSFLLSSLHFAETRVSDLISQFEFATLDFKVYGASHIKTDFKTSPDAFLQMAFQAAYFALYGKFEMTYEPAMTKSFQNGRTEAIRSVSEASKAFVKAMFSRMSTDKERVQLLRAACQEHSRITRECSSGLGQDRHLYALYCIWKEQFSEEMPIPPLFQDSAWSLMNTNVISTSNCGNPSLKSFGFGPVCANGFGIGYIIRDRSISIVVSSKHRQTKRFVSLIERFLFEMNRVVHDSHDAHLGVTSRHQSDDLRYLLSGYDCLTFV
ncbi:LAFE_0B12178g1_1 [Lachancea fermentati]|uniref:LAFE_0B12178g1_1 n=1 Tax=Lachancea fermentati TaxID=4955 RepID=A0A1G4M8T5_LACFM|nr:LAFE_0B12178g1_1 [Lachancea fermentati]